MVYPTVMLMLAQSPFDVTLPEEWFTIMGQIFNVLFALAIRGYLLLILVGLILYATGFNDTLSKVLVVFGIGLYFGGPLIVNLIASFSSIDLVTMESATAAWLELFGMTDAEIVYILVWAGDAIAGTCCLAGAILYFTPSTKELKSRGQSLIVRSLMLAPILVFFHITPLLL
jgi:type IV secretory pathway VirB2 component (pilin)